MILCRTCQSVCEDDTVVTSSFRYRHVNTRRHHNSLAALAEAADSGCYICHRIKHKLEIQTVKPCPDSGTEQNLGDGTISCCIIDALAKKRALNHERHPRLGRLGLACKGLDVHETYVGRSPGLDVHETYVGKSPGSEFGTLYFYLGWPVQQSSDPVAEFYLSYAHEDCNDCVGAYAPSAGVGQLSSSEHGNCDAQHRLGRLKGDSTSSSDVSQQIGLWLRQCQDFHPCSYDKQGSATAPTRLIDVGDAAQHHLLSIVHTIDLPEKVAYLTLSHCWGESSPILTTNSVASMSRSINEALLPKTFREAIEVARQIRIRYLWIDSMCIIQDSEQDWQQEASKMGYIYQGGVCNLAAAVSSDGEGGLFRQRRPHTPRAVYIKPRLSSKEVQVYISLKSIWKDEVEHSHLATRAWIMQERLLSPRTVYFTTEQIFWECSELLACEEWPKGIPWQWLTSTIKKPGKSLWSQDGLGRALLQLEQTPEIRTDPANDRRQGYGLWDRIVENYSAARLTVERDRLVALSGVAKAFNRYLDDQYLAGIWKNHLGKSLLWRSSRPLEKPTRYLAPSWSWASVNGPIKPFLEVSSLKLMLRFIEVHTTPRTADDTGEIIGGFLTLQANLHLVRVIPEAKRSEPEEYRCGLLKSTRNGSWPFGHLTWVYFDYLHENPLLNEQYLCMTHGSSGSRTYCILLQRVPGLSNRYTRCGLLETMDDEFSRPSTHDSRIQCEAFDPAEGYIITIV